MTKSELYLNVLFYSVSRQAFGKDVQFSLPGVRGYATISGIAVRQNTNQFGVSIVLKFCFGFHSAMQNRYCHIV